MPLAFLRGKRGGGFQREANTCDASGAIAVADDVLDQPLGNEGLSLKSIIICGYASAVKKTSEWCRTAWRAPALPSLLVVCGLSGGDTYGAVAIVDYDPLDGWTCKTKLGRQGSEN